MNLKLKTMLGFAIFGVVIGMSRVTPVDAAMAGAELEGARDVVGNVLPQGEPSAFRDDFGAGVMADGTVFGRSRTLSDFDGMHEPVAEERLIDAVYDNDFALARELVVSGAIDVNRAGYNRRYTPLSMASYRWLVPGGAEMIIFLLNHGADPTFVAYDQTAITDDNGNSHRPNIYEAWQESVRNQRRAGVRLNEAVVDAIERAFQDAIARRQIND